MTSKISLCVFRGIDADCSRGVLHNVPHEKTQCLLIIAIDDGYMSAVRSSIGIY